MAIDEPTTQFAGKPIQIYDSDKGLTAPAEKAWKIALEWEEQEAGEEWGSRFAEFLDEPGVDDVTTLVIGNWGDVASGDNSTVVVEAVSAARTRLPKLTALFLGDITMEESEISWIVQTDVSPLLAAYPLLEEFRIRGSNELSLGSVRHSHLKTLTIETGGLDVRVVRQVVSAELPALEHLELWLGDEGYGATTTVEDLGPLLRGEIFPHLTYLGLRDSEIADAIAVAIADAPMVDRLQTVDLSLGTLGDEGAQALAESPRIKRLRKLDLHHHYISAPLQAKLQKLGIEVDLSDTQDEKQYGRYVAVSE